MKKSFAIILLLGTLIAAQAQIVVGADFWGSYQGTLLTQQGVAAMTPDSPTVTSYTIAPRVAFDLGKRMQLGLALGVAHSSARSLNGYYSSATQQWEATDSLHNTSTMVSGSLFVRYMLGSYGKFSFHLEPSLSFGVGVGKENLTQLSANWNEWTHRCRDIEQRRFQLQVVPVLVYAFDSHLSMDLVLDLAALRYTHQATTRSRLYKVSDSFTQVTPDEESVETTNTFDLGLRSRTTSLISLGFNYRF